MLYYVPIGRSAIERSPGANSTSSCSLGRSVGPIDTCTVVLGSLCPRRQFPLGPSTLSGRRGPRTNGGSPPNSALEPTRLFDPKLDDEPLAQGPDQGVQPPGDLDEYFWLNKTQYEPLTLTVAYPLFRRAPWQAKWSHSFVRQQAVLCCLARRDFPRARDCLRELWMHGRAMEPLSRGLARKMLPGLPPRPIPH
jgi:hypothetical protein